MKTLETELRSGNRTLRQIKRQGMVALYELWNADALLIGYEVHVIQIREAEMVYGYAYPQRESSPRSADWGTYGWSYLERDLAGAEKRYLSLLGKASANVPKKPIKTSLLSSEGQCRSGSPSNAPVNDPDAFAGHPGREPWSRKVWTFKP